MKIKISPGNRKMGRIPNISLMPGVSCPAGVACAKDCYAQKALRQYPATREAWSTNLAEWLSDGPGFFTQINEYIQRRRPEYFRFHVAGDIPDQRYLQFMNLLASIRPQTKFLAFTKNSSLDFGNLSDNLTVVASQWPGMPVWGGNDLPRAWMQDGTEFRIAGPFVVCPGGCQDCRDKICWNLKAGESVVFPKH